MKVSIDWLKQLVDLKVSQEELVRLLPLRTIGLKEITQEFIELDMKGYNRADLLSLRGIAYEVAAITGSNPAPSDGAGFCELQEAKFVWNQTSLPNVNVDVLDSKLCPFYCIAKIEGIKVDKSSQDWVKKLETSGMRSVNNIADVTNLVMLEYGQPLHAFDADKVNRGVSVRLASQGETLQTLDGEARQLKPSDLVIADEEGPIAIAGVMGGQNSEVTKNTSFILLEAAIFDPINLKQTAAKLNLQSEASKRFQHGLTKTRLLQALNAAIQMYQSLGGKLTAISIVGNFEDKEKVVNLSLDKLNALVGIDFEEKQVEEYLSKLYFEAKLVSKKQWQVKVPYFRLDINIEEDLIEEVARLYGYEKIPAKELPGEYIPKGDQKQFTLIRDLKNTLLDLGLTEVQTYSFYSTRVLNALGIDKQAADKKLIQLANPMSLETEFLRESIWPNLLEVIDRNVRLGFKDIAIFEIGKIYYLNEKEEASEKYALTIALTNNTDNPLSELEKVFRQLNQKLDLKISEDFEKERGANLELFHPTRLMRLRTEQDKILGGLAEVHKRVTDKFGLDKKVAVLEISLIQQ